MKLNRRNFLLNSIAAGTVLPHILKSTFAQAASGPKRVIFVMTPLGAVEADWLPIGTETAFTLRTNHASLAPHKNDLIIFKGINWGNGSGAKNHEEGGTLLTGLETIGRDFSSQAADISVDQVIANSLKGKTRFNSLELVVWDVRAADFFTRVDHRFLSARGPKQHIIPEPSPQKAFDRVFGSGFPNPAAGGAAPAPVQDDANIIRRRSVLDNIAKELVSLQRQLTGDEKAKIDSHLTAIREMERRIAPDGGGGGGGGGGGPGCAQFARPGTFGIYDDATIPQRVRAQMDIITTAMACDLTRVATLTLEGGQSFGTHPFLGINTQYHEHTHGSGNFPTHSKIVTWYTEQIAYMVARLKSMQEGGGTVFDNTVILWVTEQGLRSPSKAEHNHTNLPYMILGSGGGSFKTGRFIDAKGVHHARILINIMNAMGVPGNKLSNSLTMDPLPNLS